MSNLERGFLKALWAGLVLLLSSLGAGPLEGFKRAARLVLRRGEPELSPAGPGWAGLSWLAGAEERSETEPASLCSPKPHHQCSSVPSPIPLASLHAKSVRQKLLNSYVSKCLGLNNDLAMCGIQGSQFFAFSTLKILFHCLWHLLWLMRCLLSIQLLDLHR